MQIELHRLDPDDTLVRVAPRDGERTLRTDDIESLLDRHGDAIALVLLPGFEVVTPVDPESHGAQLSLRWLGGDPKVVVEELATEGIVCDFREPDMIRVAPVPLYNTFVDVWCFVDALRRRARA